MKLSIVLGADKKDSLFIPLLSERSFHFVNDESDAYLFHLDNVDVDSYIINSAGRDKAGLVRIIENVHYLNSLITILILTDNESRLFSSLETDKVHIVNDNQELFDHLKKIPQNHRRSNRVQWPVTAYFWSSSQGKRNPGTLLSLSSSGCFIKTENPLEMDSPVSLSIKFKDFNLRADSRVVRVQNQGERAPRGMALEFKDLSRQTSHCIAQIINERILNEIMSQMSERTSAGEN